MSRFSDIFYRDLPNKDTLYDYGGRTDRQPVYVGEADFGTDEGAEGWVIWFMEYNEDNTRARTRSTRGTWTGRASLFV